MNLTDKQREDMGALLIRTIEGQLTYAETLVSTWKELEKQLLIDDVDVEEVALGVVSTLLTNYDAANGTGKDFTEALGDIIENNDETLELMKKASEMVLQGRIDAIHSLPEATDRVVAYLKLYEDLGLLKTTDELLNDADVNKTAHQMNLGYL